ncbi:hypothetical protein UFOVP661_61 [uncultured Caudovirales phage]|uniref:Uncharacterized protein n=1 Tax=uncultured Caudovirales phage TaxID=2100421 RepID=A0A6J5NH04_9CAUD|nr:hypothetical protein UFOVP661_61 [uncultured Caudovirales phage]
MATSGTYTFNPSLGELTLYAYNLIGIRNTSIVQEHMESARMATNLLLSSWSNRGVNLWAVDLVTVPLVEGQSTYTVDSNTVVILDAYVVIDNGNSDPIDRIILPISRTEYASYPNKEQQGFSTVYWFDRLLSPTVTVWPVPDGNSAQYLKYYRVKRLQDANLQSGENVEIPYLWMDAFAFGLAVRLAQVWAPQMLASIKPFADEAYQIAADQNIETAQQYISPMISGYFR